MCTIIILNRVARDWPVVLASNRDELFARPSSPPRRWPGSAELVAPVDEEKGGTWMGVAAGGFFAAITNQRAWGRRVDGKESRGDLVVALLRAGSPGAALEVARSVDARDYNPFNLLFGDASGLWVGYGRLNRAAVEIGEVPTGVHVLPNDELDCPSIPKVARIRRRLGDGHQLAGDDLLARLRALLADTSLADAGEVESPPPGSPLSAELMRRLSAVAIETELYGTRSSAIVALEDGRCDGLWYADGPPQRTEFADLGALVRDL